MANKTNNTVKVECKFIEQFKNENGSFKISKERVEALMLKEKTKILTEYFRILNVLASTTANYVDSNDVIDRTNLNSSIVADKNTIELIRNGYKIMFGKSIPTI